jgi:hypothetical protein
MCAKLPGMATGNLRCTPALHDELRLCGANIAILPDFFSKCKHYFLFFQNIFSAKNPHRAVVKSL